MNKVYTIACNDSQWCGGGLQTCSVNIVNSGDRTGRTDCRSAYAVTACTGGSYDNETLGSGGTSPSMTLNEVIQRKIPLLIAVVSSLSSVGQCNKYHYQWWIPKYIRDGSSATSTIINSGGQQYVYSGGRPPVPLWIVMGCRMFTEAAVHKYYH